MPLDEVVILDADTNQLEAAFDDVSNMPSEAAHNLKSALKKTNYPIDDHVSRAFLSAMVSLVGGYRDALRFKTVSRLQVILTAAKLFLFPTICHAVPTFFKKTCCLENFSPF